MSQSPTRIKMKCPNCDHLLDVTSIASGRKILCVRCEHVMTIPDKRRTTRRIVKRPVQETVSMPIEIPDDDGEDLFDSNWVESMGSGSGEDEVPVGKAEEAPAAIGDDSSMLPPPNLAEIDLADEQQPAAVEPPTEETSKTRRVVAGHRPTVTRSDGEWIDWKAIRDGKGPPKKK